jgi:hypothetical protein
MRVFMNLHRFAGQFLSKSVVYRLMRDLMILYSKTSLKCLINRSGLRTNTLILMQV